jgi:hypothetical protein
MIDQKSWKEFKDAGMLWWINMILHTFGWAIVYEFENDVITDVYPARVKFRGFSNEVVEDGYKKVSKFMLENAEELLSESELES